MARARNDEATGTDATPVRPTYEQARDELASVVAALEAGGLTLEESLALWERGEELAGICRTWLDAARARVSATDPDAVTPS